jgi:hypothetical protein
MAVGNLNLKKLHVSPLTTETAARRVDIVQVL